MDAAKKLEKIIAELTKAKEAIDKKKFTTAYDKVTNMVDALGRLSDQLAIMEE